jgi:hypothetical protein
MEQGLQMIGLNYEGDKSKSDALEARRFIKREKIDYPWAFANDATQQQVRESLTSVTFCSQLTTVRIPM